MAGVKLWLPPSIVKFGCLIHDEQLSSNARRICRMVAVPSSQIALLVMLMPGAKPIVFLIRCIRRCLNVRERRRPETHTSSVFSASLASLASLALLSLLLLLSVPLCPLWWLAGAARRHFVGHALVFHSSSHMVHPHALTTGHAAAVATFVHFCQQ